MNISPLAGQPPPPGMLLDVSKLITAYYTQVPDPAVPAERVAFGTSGHREPDKNWEFSLADIHERKYRKEYRKPVKRVSRRRARTTRPGTSCPPTTRTTRGRSRLLRLLAMGRVDPTPLPTHEFSFPELDRAFAMMQTKEDGIVKPLIHF